MKPLTRSLLILAGFAGLVPVPTMAAVTQYIGKAVSQIEMSVTDNCVFFQLDGVTQANGVVSGPWFAVPLAADQGKAIYAALLYARATGTPLGRVLADGNTACGMAQAYIVDF